MNPPSKRTMNATEEAYRLMRKRMVTPVNFRFEIRSTFQEWIRRYDGFMHDLPLHGKSKLYGICQDIFPSHDDESHIPWSYIIKTYEATWKYFPAWLKSWLSSMPANYITNCFETTYIWRTASATTLMARGLDGMTDISSVVKGMRTLRVYMKDDHCTAAYCYFACWVRACDHGNS